MLKKIGVVIFLLLVLSFYSWAQMPEIDRDDWISISGEIDSVKAEETITSLINLDSKPATTPIGIRISSSGGSLMAVLAICDVIKNLRRMVVTVALGEALSGAAIILSCGDKRYIGEHTIVMLHQPTVFLENSIFNFDDFIQFSSALIKMEDQMCRLIAENTGKPEKQIRNVLKKETWFTAREAIDFGLADELLSKGGLRVRERPLPSQQKKEKKNPESTQSIR